MSIKVYSSDVNNYIYQTIFLTISSHTMAVHEGQGHMASMVQIHKRIGFLGIQTKGKYYNRNKSLRLYEHQTDVSIHITNIKHTFGIKKTLKSTTWKIEQHITVVTRIKAQDTKSDRTLQ
jgi:hypothetical protein